MHTLIGIGILIGAASLLAPLLTSVFGVGIRGKAAMPARVIRERQITSGFNWDSICHS